MSAKFGTNTNATIDGSWHERTGYNCRTQQMLGTKKIKQDSHNPIARSLGLLLSEVWDSASLPAFSL